MLLEITQGGPERVLKRIMLEIDFHVSRFNQYAKMASLLQVNERKVNILTAV